MNNKTVATELAKTNKSEYEIMKSLNIGAIAKRKRLELHLSQKEVSDEICSISYLSKIETNKIVPNGQCLNLLMERIHISKNEIYLLENSKEILNDAIKHMYNLDLELYEELINDIDEVKNNQYADCIRLGYYIMIKDIDNATSIININKSLISSMDNNYLKMYSLLTAEYLLLEHKYEDANKVLNTILETDNINEMYRVLVKDYAFRLYAEQKRTVLASKLYHELINYYSEHAHIKKIIETKLVFIRMLFDDEEYNEVANMGLNSSFKDSLLSNQEFIYMIAKSFYMVKKAVLAKEYYSRLDENNKYYLFSLNEIYKLTEDKIEFINSIELKNKVESNFYYEYFLRTIYNKMDRDLFTSNLYLDALDKANKIEKVALLKIERNYLTSISRYKEANAISIKIYSMMYSKDLL